MHSFNHTPPTCISVYTKPLKQEVDSLASPREVLVALVQSVKELTQVLREEALISLACDTERLVVVCEDCVPLYHNKEDAWETLLDVLYDSLQGRILKRRVCWYKQSQNELIECMNRALAAKPTLRSYFQYYMYLAQLRDVAMKFPLVAKKLNKTYACYASVIDKQPCLSMIELGSNHSKCIEFGLSFFPRSCVTVNGTVFMAGCYTHSTKCFYSRSVTTLNSNTSKLANMIFVRLFPHLCAVGNLHIYDVSGMSEEEKRYDPEKYVIASNKWYPLPQRTLVKNGMSCCFGQRYLYVVDRLPSPFRDVALLRAEVLDTLDEEQGWRVVELGGVTGNISLDRDGMWFGAFQDTDGSILISGWATSMHYEVQSGRSKSVDARFGAIPFRVRDGCRIDNAVCRRGIHHLILSYGLRINYDGPRNMLVYYERNK